MYSIDLIFYNECIFVKPLRMEPIAYEVASQEHYPEFRTMRSHSNIMLKSEEFIYFEKHSRLYVR